MKIILLQTGKTTEKYIAEGVDDFSARIRNYNGFEVKTVPDLKNTKNMPVAEQKLKEGRMILQLINSEDYVIALDERGKELSTNKFSDRLGKVFMLSKKRIVFIIGGAWGFSQEVYERADEKMSMSKLTFSHQLVRLLFAEQLYRALTVIKGDPYHHV
jgi:23S rRNA (pseudouridine1915-N3)-methyltransferase